MKRRPFSKGRRCDAVRRLVLAGWLVSLVPASSEDPPRSPASDQPAPGIVRAPLPPSETRGLPLASVFYDLKGRSGITGGDERARRQIEEAFGIRAGGLFQPRLAELGLMRVRKLGFVREAEYAIYEASQPGQLVMALTVTLGPPQGKVEPGGIAAGRPGDFPVLYQSERAMLRFLLNGGVGFFSDGNPWFGNARAFTGRSPIAVDPADGDSASWFETSVEYGLGGVSQLGQGNVWAYGAVWQVSSLSYGQSTCVGIGGDPINGTSHLDIIKLFNDDPETEAIIMIGEIGGSAEEEAAAWIKENCKKPVAGFIAGATTPPGRRMGHVGAIVSGGQGTADAKKAAMTAAGIVVADTPSEMGVSLLKAWGK